MSSLVGAHKLAIALALSKLHNLSNSNLEGTLKVKIP